MIIHIHKADPVRRDRPVEGVTIAITEPLSEVYQPEAEQRAVFVADGRTLAQALVDSLPGATIDVLLAELLTRRGSQLRVRFPFPSPDGGQ